MFTLETVSFFMPTRQWGSHSHHDKNKPPRQPDTKQPSYQHICRHQNKQRNKQRTHKRRQPSPLINNNKSIAHNTISNWNDVQMTLQDAQVYRQEDIDCQTSRHICRQYFTYINISARHYCYINYLHIDDTIIPVISGNCLTFENSHIITISINMK